MCEQCIQETIETKWLPLYNGEDAVQCACCRLHSYVSCDGCPIQAYTGKDNCVDTLYRVYLKALSTFNIARKKGHYSLAFEYMLEAKNAVLMEIEFLRKVQEAQHAKK